MNGCCKRRVLIMILWNSLIVLIEGGYPWSTLSFYHLRLRVQHGFMLAHSKAGLFCNRRLPAIDFKTYMYLSFLRFCFVLFCVGSGFPGLGFAWGKLPVREKNYVGKVNTDGERNRVRH